MRTLNHKTNWNQKKLKMVYFEKKSRFLNLSKFKNSFLAKSHIAENTTTTTKLSPDLFSFLSVTLLPLSFQTAVCSLDVH
jgi:hypothetical protein